MPEEGIPKIHRMVLNRARQRREQGFATGIAASRENFKEWIIFWNSASTKRVQLRLFPNGVHSPITGLKDLKTHKRVLSQDYFYRTFKIIEEEKIT